MNKIRIVWCVKDKETGKLLPMAGIWVQYNAEDIESYKRKNPSCDVVVCNLIEQ